MIAQNKCKKLLNEAVHLINAQKIQSNSATMNVQTTRIFDKNAQQQCKIKVFNQLVLLYVSLNPDQSERQITQYKVLKSPFLGT